VTRPLVLLLSAACALALVAGCSAAPSTEGGFVSGDGSVSVVAAAERREPSVEVTGETIDGDQVALADLRGRIVVMPVWGSWCGPCRKEAPMLASVSEELRRDGVTFFGLNVRDLDQAQARAFVRNAGIRYPSLYDPSGETMLAFRDTLPPQAIPSFLFLDEEGRIAARVLGEISRSTLLGVVEEIREGRA
jgi:thiol-disulfide isomerase/thioredoxin